MAAIEYADVGAFASQGFIAGYVRSYARYLAIDHRLDLSAVLQGDRVSWRCMDGPASAQAQGGQAVDGRCPEGRIDPNDVDSAHAHQLCARNARSLIGPASSRAAGVGGRCWSPLVVGLGYGGWALF